MFGCKHKYGAITDGYQYCEKCGIATTVECNHKWDIKESYTNTVPCMILLDDNSVQRRRTDGRSYIMNCEKCGEVKSKRVELK